MAEPAEDDKSEQTTQPQAPRIVGGFEVDDDDEEEDSQDDGENEVDVYDPAAAVEADVSTPTLDQTPINRQSQSPIERNGITPVSAQPVGSPAGVSSSHVQSGFSFPSTDADTSAQAAPEIRAPASPTPLPSNVNGSISTAAPRFSRLPHDTIGILEDRIKEDPRGDPDAYLDLIQEYKNRNRPDDVRATYDRYLAVFPNDVSCPSISAWLETNNEAGSSMVSSVEVGGFERSATSDGSHLQQSPAQSPQRSPLDDLHQLRQKAIQQYSR